MKLVASMIVRNEMHRYLRPCIEHLEAFCDEIRVVDDGSTDGSGEWLTARPKVSVYPRAEPEFYAHEGHARQRLFEWTLAGSPTHILAIDADEFVADGQRLRQAVENPEPQTPARRARRMPRNPPVQQVWLLEMQEIWKADENHLHIRVDGGWRPHLCPIVYAVPARVTPQWHIRNRALACGREPEVVRTLLPYNRTKTTEIMHFGWTRESERQARFDRYAEHDGGKFHASQHLQSILWPDSRVQMRIRSWPQALSAVKPIIIG